MKGATSFGMKLHPRSSVRKKATSRPLERPAMPSAAMASEATMNAAIVMPRSRVNFPHHRRRLPEDMERRFRPCVFSYMVQRNRRRSRGRTGC